VLLLLALVASAGAIREARLEATVGEGRDVAVRLVYRIEAPATDWVSFSALEIDGVTIEEVSGFAAETPLSVELEPRSGLKREGSIRIPKDTDAFELRYIVRGGVEAAEDGLRVRLPCAILSLPIEETRTGLFSSAIELPRGLSVVDGFPSHPLAGADSTYHWELPLVPTFVAFRASSGTLLLTPPRIATTAVVVLLLAMGLAGIRRARSWRP
jgi:hypothetical protein